jgi:hypothetical protein
LIADGQCRSVLDSASVSPTTNEDAYNLLPGNYRAECINSNAVRFIESGCIADQCNSTSLLTGAKCDQNNSIAASFYSLLTEPEYIVHSSRDESYTCIQAFGDNVTVTFVIFGECSSPTCVIPTPAPIFSVTEAPMTTIITTNAPTTSAPAMATTPMTPTLINTPPQPLIEPTQLPSTTENPTVPPRPPTPTQQAPESGGLSTRAIVGIVVGVIFGLTLLIPGTLL